MIGEVEPLKSLRKPQRRKRIIERILEEYPTVTVPEAELFYRIRVNPGLPNNPNEFDSAPPERARPGRLSTINFPVMYASPAPETLEQALNAWNQARGRQDDALAMDGKTMKNARDETGHQTHIISVVGHDSKRCYAQKKSAPCP